MSSGALEFFAALSVALVAVYCGFNLLRLLPFPVPEQLDLKRAFFALALAPEVYAPAAPPGRGLSRPPGRRGRRPDPGRPARPPRPFRPP